MKKLVIFLIITALILVLTPSIIYAGKSPAEKATGEIEVVPISGPDDLTRIVEFNAHEAKNGITGKGIVLWTETDDGTVTLYREVIIDTVEVDGNVATFSGKTTINSTEPPDTLIYFRVTDDDPDLLEFRLGGEEWTGYNVVDGNIVVHGVTSTTTSESLLKAVILMSSGVLGKGLEFAPGLQKPFNPNSRAANRAGKKK